MKKVRKLVLEALKESGTAEEETQLRDVLEHKVSHWANMLMRFPENRNNAFSYLFMISLLYADSFKL